VQILAVDPAGKPLAIGPEALATAHATRVAASLVDTPPSELYPELLAARAREELAGLANVEIREIVGDDLLAERLGGIHAVGRCAASPPRLLIATYTPPGGPAASTSPSSARASPTTPAASASRSAAPWSR
jgi:leucyl aminopeptidase